MKKILLLSALAVASLTAGAKTADELRVYINPGHGSWTGNDRPNPLVEHQAYNVNNPDTTNFFESNTNLRKGFGVLERLIDYGLKFDRTKNQEGERYQIGAARDMENNIVMSHVKCGPYEGDFRTSNQLNSAKQAIYERYSNGIKYDKLTAEQIAEIEAQFTDAEKEALDKIAYALSRLELYNRNLTEICQEVDANNFDMFISIHSNAATEGTTTNYPLFLYRGYDNIPEADEYNKPSDGSEPIVILSREHQVESRKMSDMSWGYAIENPFMVWTSYKTSKNLRGDIDFYKSSSVSSKTFCKGYLGVLKHHVPGFLVEGYFHTYQPARHRAMNWDVSRVEGIGYARGIADYFGLEKEKFGTIYGIVRDLHEKFTHQNYKPNPLSDDVWLPINNCNVKLMKGDKVVAEYTTDNYYNGAFVFDRVEPGTYTLVFDQPQYKEIDPVEVEVKACQNSYPMVQLENVDWVPPTKVYTDYPDYAAQVKGLNPAEEYTVADVYTDEPIAELEGKIVRRAIVREGKMYILAIDKLPVYAQVVSDEEKPVPTIIVYDLNEKKVLANVSTEGTYGSIQNVSDIQLTSDGILLASCQTKTQYDASNVENLPDGTKEPRGTFYIYKWANDEDGLPTGTPEKWLSTQQTGRWYRAYAGPTFAYKGTSEEGKAIIPMPTITAPNYTFRWTSITVTNGMQAGNSDILQPASNPGEATMGDGYRYITSPVNTNNFLAVGPVVGAAERDFVMSDKQEDLSKGNDEFAGIPGTVNMFKYAGASYVVAPESKDGNNVGVRIIDITNNIANATSVTVSGSALEALEAENVATAGEVEATYDDLNDVYTAAWMNFYVLRNGKISKMTTKNVKQPVYKTEFAYGLNGDVNAEDHTYNVNYSLSGDAVAADLVLTPAEGDAVVIPLEATKGAHTYVLDTDDLENGVSYSWEVKVTSKGNAMGGEVFADKSGLDARRGGVVPITDPAAESFGYTVVGHGKAAGIDIYNPAGEKVGERMWKNHAMFGGVNTNQSNPFRGHEREGKAVLACWGDGASGLVVVDPLAKEEPVSMYAGTKQGTGHYIYEGTNIGGGIAGHCFVGEGDNTRLYTFSEDHEGMNGDGGTENSVVRYNIGNAWVITEAPTVVGYKSFLANTNVDMLGYGNGFFVSQIRGAGNNLAGCPCFAYIDGTNEDVQFTSAEVKEINLNNAGMAINKEGTIFASGEPSRIDILSVEWDGDKPSMTLINTIPTSANVSWSHMRFDYAGNLHAYERENNGYHVYAIARKAPVVSTPAFVAINGTEAGVDAVADDFSSNAPVEYWNLQGIKVNSDNLTPGIYIRRQGQKAEKVVIR